MIRASLKGLLARKARLLMSAFAVILGVAFVAGSFIFTDTLGRAFDGITTGSVGDVIVRPATAGPEGERNGGATRVQRVPASLVPEVAAVPGAARADGNIFNAGTFVVSTENKLIGGFGPPGIGTNYTGGPSANGIQTVALEEGRWPSQVGEVVLDEVTAGKSGYGLGDTVPFVTTGTDPRIEARLVGTASFTSGSLIGASVAIFDTVQAQEQFLGSTEEFNDIWVSAADGVTQDELRDEVAAVLPDGFEAVTGDEEAAASASQIQEALGFINRFLLVFAGISLVVGGFIIVNTFSILVAQRSRELALFRAIGASRRQVSRSVLVEALVISVIGGALGLAAGLLLAMAIRSGLGLIGLDLSGTGLVVRPRTALVAFAVGTVMTLVAAYLPARRAGRVPPVAAMRDDAVAAQTGLGRRVLAGVVLCTGGAAAMGAGLFAGIDSPTWWVAGGILGVLLGAALISPLVGQPVVAGLGVLYQRGFGAVGQIATQNAGRNPRRTAATASALMIGVTLVSMMAVFGSSAKASVDDVIDAEFAGDYVLSNAIGLPYSASLTDDIAAVPGVATVARMRYTPLTVGTDDTFVAGADAQALSEIVDLTVVEGSLADVTDESAVITTEGAQDWDYQLGSTMELTLAGLQRQVTVAAIIEPSAVVGVKALFSLPTLTALGVAEEDRYAFITRTPDADPAALGADLRAVVADIPSVTIKDQQEFKDEQRGPIDTMLSLIYALLGLAVVIAVLGIINTLALSVIERTREIGLLRAVGLSRRQLRTMVRLESIAIALLGAILGIVLGVSFGVALQRSLADDGITILAIPWGQLALFVAVAASVGILAAVWPGRRAGRLDILRAISAE